MEILPKHLTGALVLWCSGALRKRRGFSLLEIIISVTILSVLAAGIFATVSYSKRMTLRSEEKLAAASIVERKFNELKQKGASDINCTSLPAGCAVTSVSGNVCVYRCAESDLSLGAVTVTTTVRTPLAEGDAGRERLKEVRVDVEWTPRLNWQDASVSLTRTESAVSVFHEA